MDDLRRVRKRIRGRRFDGAGAQEQKQRPFILFRMIYHAVMLMMCICVVVLALLLNQKLNLVKMPAVIQQFHLEDLGSWLPFENWFSLKEEPVSTSPVYTPVMWKPVPPSVKTSFQRAASFPDPPDGTAVSRQAFLPDSASD